MVTRTESGGANFVSENCLKFSPFLVLLVVVVVGCCWLLLGGRWLLLLIVAYCWLLLVVVAHCCFVSQDGCLMVVWMVVWQPFCGCRRLFISCSLVAH